MPDTLQHATPVSNALQRVGDILPDTQAPVERHLTPERLGDVVDARDTISSIQEARRHPLAYRLMHHALPAAAVGGFGLGAKGGLWMSSAGAGSTDLSTAARNGLEFGALIGGATGVGLELADTLTQKSRMARARGIVGHAPQYIKERLKDPEVQDYARSYQSARSFPTRLTELGVLAGGIAGSAYGIGSTAPGGPSTYVPGFDVNLPNSQITAAGKWGLIGSAGLGAAGLLGGILMRRYRRKRLLDELTHQKTGAAVEVPHLKDGVTLQPHQKRVVKRMVQLPDGTGLLVYHGLGSGKTISAIAAGDAMGGTTEAVVPASLRENFKKEINKSITTPRRYSVDSYQSAVATGVKPADLTVFDEAHRMGREGTQVSQLGPEAHGKRILLTGTPIRNNPAELIPILQTIAPDRDVPETEDRFNEQFVDKPHLNSWWGRLMGGDKNIPAMIKNPEQFRELVKGRVDYHASRGNFPAKHTQNINVDMSPEQSDLYRSLASHNSDLSWKMRHNLPPAKSDSSRLNAFLSAARQISNSPAGFDTSLKGNAVDHSPKLQRMIHEIVKRSKDPSSKTLVYSNYLDSGVEPVAESLNKQHIPSAVFSGKLNDAQRKDMVERYNAGKLRTLLISGAGSEGLDLKGTRLVQLMEPHWNEARSDQVVGRAVRNDSHAALPEDLRNVLVQKFFTRPAPTLTQRLGLTARDQGADHYLEEIAAQKQALNDQFLRILRQEGKKNPKVADTLDKEPMVTLTDGTKVFIVSGMDVRNTKSPEFIGGGHDLVYDYVPKGEIWLDDEVDETDRPFILFHEIYERNLMSQGWDYDRAHNSANKLEGKLRKRKQSKHVAE